MRLGYFAMPLHPPGADPATTTAAPRVGALDAPAGRGGRAAAQPRGICEIPGSRPRKFPLTAPSTTRSWPLT